MEYSTLEERKVGVSSHACVMPLLQASWVHHRVSPQEVQGLWALGYGLMASGIVTCCGHAFLRASIFMYRSHWNDLSTLNAFLLSVRRHNRGAISGYKDEILSPAISFQWLISLTKRNVNECTMLQFEA